MKLFNRIPIQLFSIVFLGSLLLIGCKKEEVQPIVSPQPAAAATFDFPNTEGTFWIYQYHFVDSLGNDMPDNIYDTITVVGDTIINGYTYTMHNRSMGPLLFQRDSSGYFIHSSGYKLFSYVSPSTENLDYNTFSYTLTGGQVMMNLTDRMLGTTIQLSTVAGTFNSLVKRRTFTDLGGGPVNVCGDYEFSFDEYYSSGIGLVRMETAMINIMDQQCSMYYWELIDYHIEP